jgi:hypothetical protein
MADIIQQKSIHSEAQVSTTSLDVGFDTYKLQQVNKAINATEKDLDQVKDILNTNFLRDFEANLNNERQGMMAQVQTALSRGDKAGAEAIQKNFYSKLNDSIKKNTADFKLMGDVLGEISSANIQDQYKLEVGQADHLNVARQVGLEKNLAAISDAELEMAQLTSNVGAVTDEQKAIAQKKIDRLYAENAMYMNARTNLPYGGLGEKAYTPDQVLANKAKLSNIKAEAYQLNYLNNLGNAPESERKDMLNAAMNKYKDPADYMKQNNIVNSKGQPDIALANQKYKNYLESIDDLQAGMDYKTTAMLNQTIDTYDTIFAEGQAELADIRADKDFGNRSGEYQNANARIVKSNLTLLQAQYQGAIQGLEPGSAAYQRITNKFNRKASETVTTYSTNLAYIAGGEKDRDAIRKARVTLRGQGEKFDMAFLAANPNLLK